MKILLTQITRNPQQPRTFIDASEIAELAYSLAKDGLLNPIAVEGPQANGTFILLDGERRFRAAQELGFSQAEIARRVGKSNSGVKSKIRLLEFPPSVQKLFNAGALPLDERLNSSLKKLGWNDQESIAKICAGRKLTAAQITGLIARKLKEKGQTREYKAKTPAYKLAYSACPPLAQHTPAEQYKQIIPLIEKTCQECGLYIEGGVRTICPTCPMVMFAKLLTRG